MFLIGIFASAFGTLIGGSSIVTIPALILLLTVINSVIISPANAAAYGYWRGKANFLTAVIDTHGCVFDAHNIRKK